VIIGGRDIYESVCRACYLRRKREEPRA
jgi:thymidine kinase